MSIPDQADSVDFEEVKKAFEPVHVLALTKTHLGDPLHDAVMVFSEKLNGLLGGQRKSDRPAGVDLDAVLQTVNRLQSLPHSSFEESLLQRLKVELGFEQGEPQQRKV